MRKDFFTIVLTSDTATLQFSFIGYKTLQQRPSMDTLSVFLSVDESQLAIGPASFIEVFYVNTLTVGYKGGVRYTPIGGTLQGYATYLAGVPLFTGIDFTYQADLQNNYHVAGLVAKRLASTKDWGGYWHLETYPEVALTSFDRATIHFRVGYQGGEAKIVRQGNRWKLRRSKATWIE
jgi:hypothetical protein